jgi:hypothetical protein
MTTIAAAADSQAPWLVLSPNKQAAIEVAQTEKGCLTYRVLIGEKDNARELIRPSRLGLARGDAQFVEGLRFLGEKDRFIKDTYQLTSGKQRQQTFACNEKTLLYAAPSGYKLQIDLRACDDGVAFRYRFPDTDSGVYTIINEVTEIAVPVAAKGFLLPHDDPTRWSPAYEAAWLADIPAGTSSPRKAGWALPALFSIPRDSNSADWLLVTDSGLDESYAAVRLEQHTSDARYRIRFPDPCDGYGRGPAEPSWTLPWTLPWRVFITCEKPEGIVQSNLITHLAYPSRVHDTSWIRPGRASWSWWSGGTGGLDKLTSFVDLAAEMGWEYSLLDAGWNRLTDEELKTLLAYAGEKKVELLVWYHSGRPLRLDGPARPGRIGRGVPNIMRDRDLRRAEFKHIADMGIKGIKVDFFNSDKQIAIDQYLDILRDAAEYRLVVNFHGCTIPRGWHRTWPNLMTAEAVRGAETYRYGEQFPTNALTHNLVVPFTRNCLGPMDYTPVAFTKAENVRRTTVGHELALAVVFESGIIHFADTPEVYKAQPELVKELLSSVPTAWDQTLCLEGYPGMYIVVARRDGNTWWLAGASGQDTPRQVNIPLDFLGKARFKSLLAADGKNDTFSCRTETIEAERTFSVEIAPRGGFLARLRREE